MDGLHFVHDPAGREVGYALTDEAGWATWQGWGYHANGRQSGVMTPEGWVGYSYSPLSGWPSARSYSATLDAIHYVNINNEVWSDGLGRLTRIETNGLYDSTIVNTMSRTYAYNTKGQRNKVTYENGDYVDYTYNARNEVTGGTKKYGLRTINDGFNGVTVQNLPHTYTFDAIGSRTADATIYGGRSIINNNALNQPVNEIGITNRIKLNGAGTPGSTIVAKVNNTAQPVTRARDGAWAATGSQTLMSHQWAPVSVTETIATVATEKIGKKHFPPHTGGTVFGYDTDGNQTTDARWNHTWDGENRLTKSETLAAAATAGVPRERITYTYDAQWRRATKKVETKATATVAWVIQTHMRYAYEGWNLIAEWDIKTSPVKLVRTHHWGIDLSGTRSGAGGVGGLVMTRHHTLAGVNGSKATIPAYDGTGNILAYLDTADGKKVAEYEYGPFGEPLRETGPLAKAHPHRWSSKYTDEETGFSYYGYRYYVPQSGRWLSRDPIEERGGLGLYGFVYNNTNFWIDIDGRLCVNPGTLIGAPAGPPGMAIGTAVGWVVIGAWAVIAGGDQGPTTIQPSIPDPNPNPPPQPEPDPKPSGPNYNPTLRAQCDELMANYKKIPQEPIPPLKKPAGSEAYCENLAKRIDRMARGIAAREAFGAAGCDSDSAGWNNPAVRPFPDNKTEAQRRADHEAQLRELRESLKKMQDLYKKYCTPC